MDVAARNQTPGARERILETASRLFYRDGLRATGVDTIIAESGVAKMSFYRHFPSKSDLIEEFLRRRHDRWMAWFTQAVERRLKKPGAGMEAVADALREWFAEPDFRGCAFINAVAETPLPQAEQNAIARQHKEQLRSFLEKLAERLNWNDPRSSAAQAMIIIEGTIVRAQMTGDPEVPATCRQLLQSIGASSHRPALGNAGSLGKGRKSATKSSRKRA